MMPKPLFGTYSNSAGYNGHAEIASRPRSRLCGRKGSKINSVYFTLFETERWQNAELDDADTLLAVLSAMSQVKHEWVALRAMFNKYQNVFTDT